MQYGQYICILTDLRQTDVTGKENMSEQLSADVTQDRMEGGIS